MNYENEIRLLKEEIESLKTETKQPRKSTVKHLAFILTMPNSGSWNGKWTGQGSIYARVKTFSNKGYEEVKDLEGKNFYYSWNDGWGANVEIRLIGTKEKRELLKASKGFCGYDWMISSILKHRKIMNSKEEIEYLNTLKKEKPNEQSNFNRKPNKKP
jgi:hypothetical protein